MRSIGKTIFNVQIIFVLIFVLSDCKILDDYIQHYEEVHYDTDIVHQTHMRHKRSADHVLHLPLKAFGRELHLQLKKDSGIFTDNHKLELSNGTLVDVDLSFLYSGTVKGIPGSHCHGSVLQGIFQGSIHLPDETYHIERSNRFFSDKPVFHSVIYKESDINVDPFRERRERERREARETGTCGYDRAIEWMKEVKRSEIIKDVDRVERSAMEWQEIHTGRHNKYTASMNESPKREKREIQNLGVNNTCILELRSDPVFWDHFLTKKAANSPELAKDLILAFFSSHVQAINRIYGDTLFERYDKSLGYGFVQFAVQRTKVMVTSEDCSPTKTSESKFCEKNIDVSNFLNINSLDNHNEFCLSYMFTHRDFDAGTLGLAWVGASDRSSGGICDKLKGFEENGVQVDKSLNTGIVTNINYGKEVPSKVSQLTFAHEVGHNFGSPHDSGTECAPYGTNRPGASLGNYIMFASATQGDRQHNSEFSPCSKDNITAVLDTVLNQRYGKVNCLQAKGPFCGNGLVEDGEECDCGFDDQCKDNCCHPKRKGVRDEDDPLKCTLRSGVQCSPSEGPCCTTGCQYVAFSANQTCKYEQDCAFASYCTGNNATCPPPLKRQNGHYCNKFGFTCIDGECAGSLCERFGWKECFITGNTKEKEERERLCKLACETNGTECIVSNNMDQVNLHIGYKTMVEEVKAGRNELDADGITLSAGSPCNNFQGYCDVFSQCRGVNADGPLSRLKNLIFDPTTLQTISDWIVEHWWAVLLMAIGLVLAMGLFIKFCAVHTPSSNPKAKPARKLTDTLRRRRNPHTNQSQPQQVRYPQNPQGPPPPYPGSSHPSSSAGPPHGHGKKARKHRDMEMGRV